MAHFDLDNFLPYQLNILSERISKQFAAIYQQHFAISIAEWRVLAHLSAGAPVSVREIHERAHMEKSRVSRAASRLVQAGFVRKSDNEQDRRLVTLSLTPKGVALMAELAPVAAEFEAQVLAQIGAEAPQFRGALEALLRAATPEPADRS